MSLDSKAMRGQIILVILVVLISLPWVIFGPDKISMALQKDSAGELMPIVLRSDRLGSQWKLQFNLNRPLPDHHDYLFELVVITADGTRHQCTFTELTKGRHDSNHRTLMSGFTSTGLADVRQVEWKIGTAEYALLHLKGDWVQLKQPENKDENQQTGQAKASKRSTVIDRKAAVVNITHLHYSEED